MPRRPQAESRRTGSKNSRLPQPNWLHRNLQGGRKGKDERGARRSSQKMRSRVMRRTERQSRRVTRELGPTRIMVLREERLGSGLVSTTVRTTESVKTKVETAAQRMNLETTSCSGR